MSNRPNSTFRPSMNWVHTWAGLLLGALIFTVFWMGTLTVFNHEIDRWMQPETRLAAGSEAVDIDQLLAQVRSEFPGKTITEASFGAPDTRRPFGWGYFEFANGDHDYRLFNANTGEKIEEPTSFAGTDFIYPMHIRLFAPGIIGWWLVLMSAFAMMLLVVTGVIIHRKLIADFFTFRPNKKLRRSGLDLHNLTGVLFMPFHFLIAFSGVMIFSGWYTSFLWDAVPGKQADQVTQLVYVADDYGYYARPAAGSPGGAVPLAPLVTRAEAIWSERYGETVHADYVQVAHVGDANGYVSVRRSFPERQVNQGVDTVAFDLGSGEIIVDYTPTPSRNVQRWLAGFHFIQFDHWPLRWLYFIGGLAGCLMIATGFVFWTASRSAKFGETQPLKVRLVEVVSVGSVTGLIAGTCAFFVANRLLPHDATWLGQSRAMLEVWIFFLTWIASFVHAGFRGSRAWTEQSFLIAGLGLSAVLLNWITTGDHLVFTIERGLWSVAGMDIVLLAGSAVAVWSGFKLAGHDHAIRKALLARSVVKSGAAAAE